MRGRAQTGRGWVHGLVGLLVMALAGCVSPKANAPATGGGPNAANPAATAQSGALRFWHTQTQENKTALEAIVARYNQQHPAIPVEATYMGDYSPLFEKIKAAAAQTRNRMLPDLAVAYESMIAEYMTANIVRPLDDLVSDPKVGLDEASRKDIFPAYLLTNTFPAFGNQLLSFPFTKSNLMLYYNQDLLKKLGATAPATWSEFLAVCRAIKQKLPGVMPVVTYVDPSTVDALILSMGGKLISDDGLKSRFNEPGTLDAFKLLDTLYKEKLAYQVADKGQQNTQFGEQKCVFFFRTSAARSSLDKLVGSKFGWGMTGIPAKDGLKPMTVMFGGNICIFRSTPERERAAWEFIKYFTSPEVTAEWAVKTGYLPVRKSAAEAPEMRKFFDANPRNRAAFELLPVAVPEPNAAGWQAVRNCLQKAETATASQVQTPDAVVQSLASCANAALAKAKEH